MGANRVISGGKNWGEIESLEWLSRIEAGKGRRNGGALWETNVKGGKGGCEVVYSVLSRWCILYYHMDYSNLT